MITVQHPDGQTLTFSIDGDILSIKRGVEKTTRVPLRVFTGLREATDAELAQFEVIDGGDGLHWPSLDAHLHVPSLLEEFGR